MEIGECSIFGIFFKYDIEFILLIVEEKCDGMLMFFVKVINVVSGVLVVGYWGFMLSDWFKEVIGKR